MRPPISQLSYAGSDQATDALVNNANTAIGDFNTAMAAFNADVGAKANVVPQAGQQPVIDTGPARLLALLRQEVATRKTIGSALAAINPDVTEARNDNDRALEAAITEMQTLPRR